MIVIERNILSRFSGIAELKLHFIIFLFLQCIQQAVTYLDVINR